MLLRFRKSVKLGPGMRLNLGKKNASMSVGGKGFRYNVSTTGRRTTTVSAPGTGLSYSSSSGGSRGRGSAGRQGLSAAAQPTASIPTNAGASLPKPGMFAPAGEKRFYEGVQAYLKGDFAKALTAFEAASAKDRRNISDELFAGLVAVKLEQPERAIPYFSTRA